MLNLHQLNVFLIAAETLNFTQAAQRLEMSQPSVSQHIQSLEQHFDLPLFIRSGRSLELTEAGLALLPQAREMIYLSNNVEEQMTSIKGDVYGHLFVGCSTTTGRYVLPILLAEFHRLYPQVRATCHVTSQENSMQMLCDGKVHLALCSTPDVCKEVEFRHFITDQILLIAPLSHPWSQAGVISATDLYNEKFILPEEDSDVHTTVHDALADAGISIYQLQQLLTLGSAEGIALAVKEGLGVGFVSSVVVKKLAASQVGIIKIEGISIPQEIYLGKSINRKETAAQCAFWDFVFKFQETVTRQIQPELI